MESECHEGMSRVRGASLSNGVDGVSDVTSSGSRFSVCQDFSSPDGGATQQHPSLKGRREREGEEEEEKKKRTLFITKALVCSLQKVIARRRSLMSWVTDCRVGGIFLSSGRAGVVAGDLCVIWSIRLVSSSFLLCQVRV